MVRCESAPCEQMKAGRRLSREAGGRARGQRVPPGATSGASSGLGLIRGEPRRSEVNPFPPAGCTPWEWVGGASWEPGAGSSCLSFSRAPLRCPHLERRTELWRPDVGGRLRVTRPAHAVSSSQPPPWLSAHLLQASAPMSPLQEVTFPCGSRPCSLHPSPSFSFLHQTSHYRKSELADHLFYLVHSFNKYLLNTYDVLTSVFQGIHQCLAKQRTPPLPAQGRGGAQSVIREDEK